MVNLILYSRSTCLNKVLAQGTVKRLAIPYFSWGLIYFVVKSTLHKSIDIGMLFKQFAFGAPACSVMYFILLLAVCTLLLHFVCRFQYSLWMIAALAVVFLVAQYSGLNFLVAKCFGQEGAVCVGRFFELFPHAVVGYVLYKKGEWLCRNKIACVVVCAIMGACGFLPDCGGYGYQGLGMLFVSATIFSVFCLVGMKVKTNLSAVRFVASLTAGVYYMHLLVGWSLERVIGEMGKFAVPLVLLATACCVWAMTKIKYARVLVK